MPKNILLTTVWANGDVLPFVRIGRALKARGHRVTLVTHAYFEGIATAAGLEFEPIDTIEEYGRFTRDGALFNSANGFLTVYERYVLPKLAVEYEILRRRCGHDTILVARATPGIAARMAAEKLRIPLASIYLGPSYVRTIPLVEELLGTLLGAEINRIRDTVGLPPVTNWSMWLRHAEQNIGLWPEWFAPMEGVLPVPVRLAGFLWNETAADAEIPPDVRSALNGIGEPPVLITGGSSMLAGAQFFTSCVDACRLLQRRGIIVTRHDELVPRQLPTGVTRFRHVPNLKQLMPHTAAVIHHGGIITSVEALAAGVPQLALVVGGDRPDNAAGFKRLGVGDYLLPPQWNSETVAERLRHLAGSPRIAAQCREYARRLVDADVLSTVCDLIEQIGAATPAQRAPAAGEPVPVSTAVAGDDDRSRVIGKLSPTKRALLERRLRRNSKSQESAVIPRLPRTADGDCFALSFAQQRLWFLHQLEPGSAAYHLGGVLHLDGLLDIDALRRAIVDIGRRHEMLRTTFAVRDGQPVQVIDPSRTLTVEVVDLEGLDRQRREVHVANLADEERRRPFDLGCDPLFRVTVLRVGPAEHVLMFTLHHLVFDGWSMGILVSNLKQLYEAHTAGRPSPLPELPIQYADFAVWHRAWLQGEAMGQQLAYWKEQLKGAPPLLELPTDQPRPAVQTRVGAIETLAIRPELSRQLKELCREKNATPFMLLLAAFKILLMRHSGQTDLVVGSPVANRSRRQTEELIGFFVDTLVLRTDLSGNPTFLETLNRVRDVAVAAYAHQDVPFERLVQELQPDRSLGYSALFQVFFNMLGEEQESMELPGVQIKIRYSTVMESKFDLTVYAQERDGCFRFDLVYNQALFSRERMAEMLAQFEQVLTQVIRSPNTRINELPLVTGAFKAVLPAWTAGQSLPGHEAVHDRFQRCAGEFPDAIAIREPQRCWSYRELDWRSNQLANCLLAGDIRRGDRVAIYSGRTSGLILALLGILKAGASFVILDPAHPSSRLKACLASVRAPACLVVSTSPGFPPELEDFLKGQADFRLQLPIAMATAPDSLAEYSVHAPATTTDPDQEAYVAFTSGSTGVPKGIVGTHRPLAHFIEWHCREFELNRFDRFSLLSGLSHDPLLRDIFTPLSLGAEVCIPPETCIEQEGFASWINQCGITVMHLTPALGQVLTVDAGKIAPTRLEQLRFAFFGGDVLRNTDIRSLREVAPKVACVNFYGTTETPQAIAFHRCSGEDTIAPNQESRGMPVGRGIEGVDLLVLNSSKQLAGAGELGEIWVRSPYLAKGYLQDADLSRQPFQEDWFGQSDIARLFPTGDLGRYLPNGDVDIVGRRDRQLNIHGFRVEPGDIELALNQCPAVRQSVVVGRNDAGSAARLVAYVVPTAERPASGDELRTHLRALLPGYMMPDAFVLLEKLPLTANGKIDQRALPMPRRESAPSGDRPTTPTEELVAGIWQELIKVKRIGIFENFFEVGGHSLLAIQVISRIRQVFKVEVSLAELFTAPTIAGLSRQIERALRSGSARPVPALVRTPDRSEFPASVAQERLWILDQLDSGNPAYFIPGAVQLNGALDLVALQRAVDEIVRRHEVLRTHFELSNGRLVQRIHPAERIAISVACLGGLDAAGRKAAIAAIAWHDMQRGFDLASGTLLRIQLARMSDTDHVLFFTLHHIVADGWSIGVIQREIAALYAAFSGGQSSTLDELPVQYGDFAAWQRAWLSGEVLQEHLEYWTRQLKDVPTILALPSDRQRSAIADYHGADHNLDLDRDLSFALDKVSQEEGVTLFVLLSAAFKVLLSRWSGQTDFVIGTLMANRGHESLEKLVGLFLNTLLLRANVSDDPTFGAFLRREHRNALDAYAHEALPFEQLMQAWKGESDKTSGTLLQVMFLLQNFPRFEARLPGLSLSAVLLESGAANLDLRLAIITGGDALTVSMRYNTQLFDADTIRDVCDSYVSILREVLRDRQRKISEFTIGARLQERREVCRRRDRGPALCIAATFTAELLEQPVGYWLRESGMPMPVKFASYNQLFQQLLDPTSLLSLNHEGVNAVLVRIDDLSPGRTVDPEKIRGHVRELFDALQAARTRSNAPYVVGICPAAPEIQEQPWVSELEKWMVAEARGRNGLILVTSVEWLRAAGSTPYFDAETNEQGHIPYTVESFAAMGMTLARKIHSLKLPAYKVIALDCDQTLWKGVCGEVGPDGIEVDTPRLRLQEFMLEQQRAGRLLCLCSRNNESEVFEVFRRQTGMPLKPEHFVAWRINWKPKSENLKSLAVELNLGLDSFVFVDDDPVECAEVQTHCPEVSVLRLPPRAEIIPAVLEHFWPFDVSSATQEDLNRTELYRRNQERERSRQVAPSLEAFLAGLQLRVDVHEMTPDELGRVAQLVQRTNQFNLTAVRRDEAQIRALWHARELQCLTVSVEDRFGTYGLVGVIFFKWNGAAIHADTFLLSCRALGKGVEFQMLRELGRRTLERGLSLVELCYCATGRNFPALEFLEALAVQNSNVVAEHGVCRMPAAFAAAATVSAGKPPDNGRPNPPAPAPSAVRQERGSHFERIARLVAETDRVELARRSLKPSPPKNQRAIFKAPRTPIEQMLARRWNELLGVEDIGVDDDFFALGGHSLMGTVLLSVLRKDFPVELRLRQLFEHPTLGALAGLIEESLMSRPVPGDAHAFMSDLDSLTEEQLDQLIAGERRRLGEMDGSAELEKA